MDPKQLQTMQVSACPLLTDENYNSWRQKMEAVLVKQRLFHIVENAPPLLPNRAWRERNSQARATITLNLGNDQLIHIRDLVNAYDCWRALHDVHMRVAPGSSMLYFQKLSNKRLKRGQSLQRYLTEMKDLRNQLAERSFQLQEGIFCFMILNSLHDGFGPIASQLSALPAPDLTVARVCATLLNEEDRCAARIASNGGEATNAISPGFASQPEAQALKVMCCFSCNQTEHVQKFCKGRKEKRATESSGTVTKGGGKSKKANAIVLITKKVSGTENFFVIDTGASIHMTNRRDLFTMFKQVRLDVQQANEKKLSALGIGQIYVESLNMTINDVYFVPDLVYNLLSVNQLTEKDFDVVCHKKTCVISKDGKDLTAHKGKDGLYLLSFEETKSKNESQSDCETSADVIENVAGTNLDLSLAGAEKNKPGNL